MIKYFKRLFTGFKNAKLGKKALICFAILIYLGVIAITVIPVNYTIVTPGVASKASSIVTIPNENENKTGTIYTLGVYSDSKVSLLRYLLSVKNDKYDVSEYDPKTMESDLEESIGGRYMKEVSINNAIIAAYSYAKALRSDIVIEYSFKGMIVDQLFPEHVDRSIKLGDIITHVKGLKIESEADFKSYVTNDKVINNYLNITVLRNNESVELNLYLNDYLDSNNNVRYYLGFYCEAYYEIDSERTYPKFTINQSDTIGPSGGMMQALSIYNSLIKEDITKGKVALGTGTISLNYINENEVKFEAGAIGAIKQKIITATLYDNIDVFFVDYLDYNDAKKAYDQYAKGKFDLVSVSSFSDVIDYFKGVE